MIGFIRKSVSVFYLVIILILFVSPFIYSQQQYTIREKDSLKELLTNTQGEERVQILDHISYYYRNTDNEQSINLALEAYTLAQNLGDKELLSEAAYYLGTAYHHAGNYPMAIRYALDAYEMVKGPEGSLAHMPRIELIVMIYLFSGNADLAVKVAKDYYDSLEPQSFPPEQQFEFYIRLGWVYMHAEQNERAIYYFLLADSLATSSNIISPAKVDLNSYHLSNCHLKLKDHDRALYFARNSQNIIRSNQLFDNGDTYNKMADCFIAMGMLDSALHYSLKALKIQLKEGIEGDLMHTYAQLGSIQQSLGNLDKAREYYTRSLHHSQWVIDNKSFYSARELGWYTAPQNVSASFGEQGLKSSLNAHKGLHRIFKAKGDDKATTYHLEQIIEVNNRIKELNKDKEVLELNTKYETERKEQQILLLEKESELAKTNVRQTRLFLFGISGILLAILLMVLLFLRQNRLKAEQDKILLQQRLFRSQMNPHFLYNSLASIQNFIITEDPEKASVYLSRFANLVRSILDSSNEEFIPLEEEIDLIENYLSLQKIRYDEKFDYVIEVDDTLDPEIIVVPPMLTQPFIENAILHGLKPKKEKGRMIVRFRRLKDCTLFEVEDDGVGRAKSQEMKRSQGEGHKSLAISITQQRIAALNKKHRMKITMEIIDLKDKNSNATGTKVVFVLPIG